MPGKGAAYPLVAGKGGVKVRPELMERERLYHCMFEEKIMLVYKDGQEVLHCYEVEERELVDRVRESGSDAEVEDIFEEYVKKSVK